MATITDSYGRTINVTVDDGGFDVYTYAGISISFTTGTPQVQALTALEGMANAAPVNTVITFLQFIALLAPTEQTAIAASADPEVKLFTLMAAGAGPINLADPRVAAGVDYRVSVGLLTSGRATAILANQAP